MAGQSRGPEKMSMAALLGLAVLIVLSSPARLALAIFQARWARGAFVQGAGLFFLLLIAEVIAIWIQILIFTYDRVLERDPQMADQASQRA